MSRLILVYLSLVATFVGATACLAQQADVRGVFLASNPNNGWEYGFIDENGVFVAYNTTFDDGQGIAGWCLDRTPGPLGDITINYSDHPIDRYGVHWDPGQICANTPSPGISVVIRWHAPNDATVKVNATLTSQSPNTSADVSLSSDGQELADGEVGQTSSGSGTDGPHAASVGDGETGGQEEVTRSITTSVDAGDTVDIVITANPDQPSGHVGAVILIGSVNAQGVVTDKAKLGKRMPAKQAMLFGIDQWSNESEFDALLRRG